MENLKLYLEYDGTRKSRQVLIRDLEDLLKDYAKQKGLRYVRFGIDDRTNYDFGWRIEPQSKSKKVKASV